MSYTLPESSFNTYLSPCFTTVPEKVWLPLASVEAPADGLAVELPLLAPASGLVASGVEDGLCDEGDCEDAGAGAEGED